MAPGDTPWTTMVFTSQAVSVDPFRIGTHSSRGPSVDASIKPELMAVGTSVYTAEPLSAGISIGYATLSGTSLSAPMVSGAAAVLKAARPGLTALQYRSLLINSAAPFAIDGTPSGIQLAGAGLLDVPAALQTSTAVVPSALGFGTGSATIDRGMNFTVSNLGTAADTFSISPQPYSNGPVPSVSENSIFLQPGASKEISVRFQGSGLSPGEYQGFVVIQGTRSGYYSRVPYWYGIRSNVPANVTILLSPSSAQSGSVQSILFRTTDAAGIPLFQSPVITSESGNGSVLTWDSVDSEIPGAYLARVRMSTGGGNNVFRIRVGSVSRDVTISVL
jgi:hypothetical protein